MLSEHVYSAACFNSYSDGSELLLEDPTAPSKGSTVGGWQKNISISQVHSDTLLFVFDLGPVAE